MSKPETETEKETETETDEGTTHGWEWSDAEWSGPEIEYFLRAHQVKSVKIILLSAVDTGN